VSPPLDVPRLSELPPASVLFRVFAAFGRSATENRRDWRRGEKWQASKVFLRACQGMQGNGSIRFVSPVPNSRLAALVPFSGASTPLPDNGPVAYSVGPTNQVLWSAARFNSFSAVIAPFFETVLPFSQRPITTGNFRLVFGQLWRPMSLPALEFLA